jgi:hypothetical protein
MDFLDLMGANFICFVFQDLDLDHNTDIYSV